MNLEGRKDAPTRSGGNRMHGSERSPLRMPLIRLLASAFRPCLRLCHGTGFTHGSPHAVSAWRISAAGAGFSATRPRSGSRIDVLGICGARSRENNGRRGESTARQGHPGEGSDAPVPSPTMIPPPAAEYSIDLSTARRLAEAENPTIAAARAGSSKPLPSKLPRGRSSCPRSTSAPTTTCIRATFNGRPGRCSIPRCNRSISAAVPWPQSPARWNIPMINLVGTLTEAWFRTLGSASAGDRVQLHRAGHL